MKDFKNLFPYLKHNKDVIYFDNAATSLKPDVVIDSQREYLELIAANPHSQDYGNAFKAWEVLNETRSKILTYVNAPKDSQVIFTSGATHSFNQIAFGLKNFILKDDEVLTTTLEHSSTLLPLMEVCKLNSAKLKLLDLKKDGTIDVELISQKVNSRTKLVAFASSTNVIGGFNDIENIVKEIRKINPKVLVAIDLSQSVGHEISDFKKWDIDFAVFSAHKMYGPFGVGVLWGKNKFLEMLVPIFYGGGMSGKVAGDLSAFQVQDLPERLEGGTPNISGIYGFNKALDFINSIGLSEIVKNEVELKKYVIEKASKMDKDLVKFYNLQNHSPLLTFSIRDYNPQDIATFLWVKYKIQIRSGSHCARIVSTHKGFPEISLRASFSFFNTKAEIDKLFEAIGNSDDFISAII